MLKTPPKIGQIYNDLTKKSAILDISEYGRITLTGTDALDLINPLVIAEPMLPQPIIDIEEVFISFSPV